METLVNITKLNPITLFSQDAEEMKTVIKKIRSHVNFSVLDATTEKGRAEITSLAYKVTRSKTALDDCGKIYVSEIKAKSKIIDKVRSDMRKELEALSDEVRKPVTDFEIAEKKKDAEIQERIAALEEISFLADDSDLYGLKVLLEKAENFIIDESLGNMQEVAIKMKESICNEISEQVKKEERLEAERKELEAFRKEKEEKEAREEKEAAEKAIIERATKAANDKAELEKKQVALKIEKDRIEQEEKINRIERAKIAAEEKSKLETQRAEKAEKEKEEAIKQAKINQENAVKEENERVKKEEEEKKKREIEQEAARRANIEHHREINNETLEDIVKTITIGDKDVKLLIKEIALGNIRNLKIRY